MLEIEGDTVGEGKRVGDSFDGGAQVFDDDEGLYVLEEAEDDGSPVVEEADDVGSPVMEKGDEEGI